MNNKTDIDVQYVSPLKKICMTIGELPSSYLETMSYYEMLVWFTEYIKNTLIPTINNNAEATSELQSLYEELRTYVNDYFDNLDVQEEINNKLDDMAEDGSLINIIKSYVDPIYEAFENDINDEINDFKDDVTDDINTQNSNIASIDSRVNGISTVVSSVASGAPKPVANISDMTDTTKTYVLTTDGNWYYYDGDSWEIGGTYQATSIGENEIHIDNLDTTLQGTIKTVVPTFSFTDGYYRNSNGIAATNNVYKMSSPYALKQGEILYICCNGGSATNVSVIANVTSTGDPIAINTNVMNVRSIGDVINVYSYTAPFDCYVSLSLVKANDYIYAYIDKSKTKDTIRDDILGFSFPEYSIVPNKYRNGSSIVNHNLYGYTSAIQLKAKETIKFHGKAEGNAITLVALVDSSNTYISTLLQSNGTKEYDVEYTATTDCYVSLCSDITYFKNVYILKAEDEQTNYQNELFTSFLKFGVIGDSLASGEAVANNGGVLQYIDNYDYSWGQFIARNHGMTCINFSKGGATTRSFLNPSNTWGLTKLLNPDNKCNAYVIGLGVNDPSISSYLGSVEDIHLDDFTQNADTFYGNYARIIGYIKQVQPKAKIFMLTMPADYGGYLTAIRTIAGLYDEDVYLIDLYADYYKEFASGFVEQNKREGHYNAIAYNYIGEILYTAFTDFMIKNYSDFKQIEFIGTDYSYTT